MQLFEGSDKVFIHPGMVPGTQLVFNECELNSDKYFLGASCQAVGEG